MSNVDESEDAYGKIPNRDPGLSDISDPQTQAKIERIWNVLLRAYDSEQFENFDEKDVEMAFFDVILNPGAALSESEVEKMERFQTVLGNDRTGDRDWANLTAIETSFLQIVPRGVKRLNADPVGREQTPLGEFIEEEDDGCTR